MFNLRVGKFKIKRFRHDFLQTNFNEGGGLLFQATLLRWKSHSNVYTTQLTLYEWISKSDRARFTPPAFQGQFPCANEVKHRESRYTEIPKTMSCIELEMRHDKHGHVVGWMEGEPKADDWDGSIDDHEITLEKHVGKYGWAF